LVVVTDAAAPHGQYLWLPDAAYPDNFNAPVKTQHRAEYQFLVPHAGQWLLRGLVQSSDTSSDSFWVEIDGNQALGIVYLWDTAPIGTAYAWDYLNNRTPATDPVELTLSAGTHTVTIYGRDDGTRLDRLELESIRSLVTLAGPSGVVSGNFQVTVTFSESVTGLAAGDFAITGGTVLSLAGSGANYTLDVAPAASTVDIALPENAASDSGGAGNFPSNPLTVIHRTPYEQWAFDHDVDGTVASQLADEDGDGIAKLLEFAFNLDPSAADRSTYDPAILPGAGLPRMIVSAGPTLSLQYLRRKGVPGLSYTAQFGTSLDDFANAGGSPVVESIDDAWERVTIADVGGGSASTRFGRVVVTLGAP
jgi:hypothetical protein